MSLMMDRKVEAEYDKIVVALSGVERGERGEGNTSVRKISS